MGQMRPFIWLKNQVDPGTILDIAKHKDLWGQSIPEPYICLKDIPLNAGNVQLMGVEKGHPTLKIQLDNNVSIIRFKASEEEYQSWLQPNIVLTGICKCARNEWNGRVTPQFILEDYDLEAKWIF